MKGSGGERMKHDGGGPDRSFLITAASPSTRQFPFACLPGRKKGEREREREGGGKKMIGWNDK